jgi:hypothetical protein
MAVATKLTPTYPLALGGYTFPGYTAFYTMILNLAVAIVLTPLFNAWARRKRRAMRPSRPIITPDAPTGAAGA